MKSYKDLPRDYRFASEREWEKKRIITEALIKLKIHSYSTMFQSFDSFEDFKVNRSVGVGVGVGNQNLKRQTHYPKKKKMKQKHVL